jgi:hypothetical protein
MVVELDMSKYKPYKDQRGLSKFKSLKDRKMFWPMNEKHVLDSKYLLRPLRDYEIDDVVEIYREGFPELYGNDNHGVALWSDSISELLKTEKGFMQGSWFIYVAEKLDMKKIVGVMLIRMDKGNMSIHWESGVIHPQYRGARGLFKEMCIFNDELSEKSGAEYSSIIAATFHPITQKYFKELGWKLRGVFPGFLLSWNHEDKYYRRSVVMFDKFFNNGKELVPKTAELIPEAEKIFNLSEE